MSSPSGNLADSSLSFSTLNGGGQEKVYAKFLEHFPVMGEFPLVDHFSCAFQREILAHGRLYLTMRGICFYANILGWVTKLCVNFEEVIYIEKKATARIFNNAIQIKTLHAKMLFASFGARDLAFGKIVAAWRNSLLRLKLSPMQIKLGTSSEGSGKDELVVEVLGSAVNPFSDSQLDERDDEEIVADSERTKEFHLQMVVGDKHENNMALNQLSVRSIDELKEYFCSAGSEIVKLESESICADVEVPKKTIVQQQSAFLEGNIEMNMQFMHKILVKEPKLAFVHRFIQESGHSDAFSFAVGEWKVHSDATKERSLSIVWKVKVFGLSIWEYCVEGWQQVSLQAFSFDGEVSVLETYLLPSLMHKSYSVKIVLQMQMEDAFCTNVKFFIQLVQPSFLLNWACEVLLKAFFAFLQQQASAPDSALQNYHHSHSKSSRRNKSLLNFYFSIVLVVLLSAVCGSFLLWCKWKRNPIALSKKFLSTITNPNPKQICSIAAQAAREAKIALLQNHLPSLLLADDK